MKKRIIKKHMKNGLSRNSLERLNKQYKRKINWLERGIDLWTEEVDKITTEYNQLSATYREDMSYYIEKIKNREKINEGLKTTIEKLMQERYDERASETRLMQELDEEIRSLQEENSEMRAELLRIREKEENSGIVQKMMRRAFNL